MMSYRTLFFVISRNDGDFNHTTIQLSDDNKDIMFANPVDSFGYVSSSKRIEYIFSGDWSLQKGSICIDEGNNLYHDEPTVLDLSGNPGIFNGIFDMGVYELQEPVDPVINSVALTSAD